MHVAPSRPAAGLSDLRIAVALAVASWLTCVFIGPGDDVANMNAVPRMGLVFALLRDHGLAIDEFARFTPDKAFFDGHFYNDKAPGLSFLALPAVAVASWLAGLAGLATDPVAGGRLAPFYTVASMVAAASTAAVFTAICTFCLYRLARLLGASVGAAIVGSAGYAFATPALGWGTVFFGHGVAGACLFIGLTAAAFAVRAVRPGRAVGLAVLAGSFLGWAVAVEFTCAPAAALIALWALWTLRGLKLRRSAAIVAAAAGACLVPAALLMAYNHAAFGSPFSLGYRSVAGFEGMRQGFLGVSAPRLDVLLQIVFGLYRGLLPIAPVLVLAPFGLVAAARRFDGALCLVLLLVPASFLAINAGYFYWDGGASTGPRHVAPALPFLAFTLVPLWDAIRRRWVVIALLAASVALSVICASVTMAGANGGGEWLLPWLLRRFVAGDVHNLVLVVNRYAGGPLGGPARLATLLVIPALWAAVFAVSTRRARRAERGRPAGVSAGGPSVGVRRSGQTE